MKKYLILGLLALIIGSMVIVPMLQGDSDEDVQIPAEFGFKDNLATRWDEAISLEININSEEIVKLELIYNDSVFKIWNNPKSKIVFPFNAGYFGLGAKSISLVSTLKNGEIITDNRLVRVLSDIKPEIWFAKVVATYPHLETSYTQGLEFNNGVLYEGTGQYGESMIAQTNLTSGTIDPNKNIRLDENYFGEGITIFGDNLFQLTWKEQKCFVYNKNTMQLIKDIPYTGEGWGLCNDGNSLIMSDGSERITFRDPATFSIQRVIEVYDNEGPIQKINELEYIDGKIYANIYTTNKIIVIEPSNGKILAVIDCDSIEQAGRGLGGEVMNGIAYNNGKIYLTGKHWGKLFEVKIEK
jgi:glutamine cyclotransferase